MKLNSLPFNTTTLKDKKHVFHWREFTVMLSIPQPDKVQIRALIG